MACGDVSVEVGHLAAAHRADEIGLMVLRALLGKLFDLFAVLVKDRSPFSATGVITMFALNHDSDADAVQAVHRPIALLAGQIMQLKNDRRRLIVKNGNLGIRCFGIIIE